MKTLVTQPMVRWEQWITPFKVNRRPPHFFRQMEDNLNLYANGRQTEFFRQLDSGDNLYFLGNQKMTSMFKANGRQALFHFKSSTTSIICNGRWPQFSIKWKGISILAPPSLAWACHSSAPACVILLLLPSSVPAPALARLS